MTRPEAQAAVSQITESLPQSAPYPPCQGVKHAAARNLLGDELFSKMLADRIRSGGPKPGYVYPWNVVDYLDDATKLGV